MRNNMQSRLLAILPYKIGSQSAANLAQALEQSLQQRTVRLYNDRPNPNFIRRGVRTLVNWGCSRSDVHCDRIFNQFDRVAVASNKLSTFQALKDAEGVRIPEFTADKTEAIGWFNSGKLVVARHKLTGHSGAGIQMVGFDNDEDEGVPIPWDAPLFVRYVKKQKEFRVHVAFGEVIDVQEKRQRADVPEEFVRNFQVRNHHTGWVYCRENIEEPGGMRGMALATVARLGLDFGAVDIIYNRHQDACYVLEVNSAPGLEGTTVTKYAEAFTKQVRA